MTNFGFSGTEPSGSATGGFCLVCIYLHINHIKRISNRSYKLWWPYILCCMWILGAMSYFREQIYYFSFSARRSYNGPIMSINFKVWVYSLVRNSIETIQTIFLVAKPYRRRHTIRLLCVYFVYFVQKPSTVWKGTINQPCALCRSIMF